LKGWYAENMDVPLDIKRILAIVSAGDSVEIKQTKNEIIVLEVSKKIVQRITK